MVERTCNCFEEIEKALEKIKNEGFTIVSWRIYSGEVYAARQGGERGETVPCDNACGLPSAIKELADKVDPPKPKEREWRVGDVIRDCAEHYPLTLVSQIANEGKKWYGTHGWGKRCDRTVGHSRYSNLTIEAEKGIEK